MVKKLRTYGNLLKKDDVNNWRKNEKNINNFDNNLLTSTNFM